ncbi:hypothetical protein BDW22DRAFT_677740 [Trametopsis cervina]|nr:hypothetical protein BDW22DRAFT_677740 [Trametopsis cervina]
MAPRPVRGAARPPVSSSSSTALSSSSSTSIFSSSSLSSSSSSSSSTDSSTSDSSSSFSSDTPSSSSSSSSAPSSSSSLASSSQLIATSPLLDTTSSSLSITSGISTTLFSTIVVTFDGHEQTVRTFLPRCACSSVVLIRICSVRHRYSYRAPVPLCQLFHHSLSPQHSHRQCHRRWGTPPHHTRPHSLPAPLQNRPYALQEAACVWRTGEEEPARR